MNRKVFLQNSLFLSGAAILPNNSVFAASLTEGGMDKLTDANGNFALLPLPMRKAI